MIKARHYGDDLWLRSHCDVCGREAITSAVMAWRDEEGADVFIVHGTKYVDCLERLKQREGGDTWVTLPMARGIAKVVDETPGDLCHLRVAREAYGPRERTAGVQRRPVRRYVEPDWGGPRWRGEPFAGYHPRAGANEVLGVTRMHLEAATHTAGSRPRTTLQNPMPPPMITRNRTLTHHR